MFKVLCVVNEVWWVGVGPKYGEIDTVTEVVENWGKPFYKLERFPNIGFLAKHFVPLSSIDETELIKERETVNA